MRIPIAAIVIVATLCVAPAAAQPTPTPRDQAWLARFQLPPPTPGEGPGYQREIMAEIARGQYS